MRTRCVSTRNAAEHSEDLTGKEIQKKGGYVSTCR